MFANQFKLFKKVSKKFKFVCEQFKVFQVNGEFRSV